MAFEVIETSAASRDLEGILEYIANSLANPAAASSFADEVEKRYGDLERSPFIFERCRDPRLAALGYRKALIKNYVLIYKVDEASQTVYALRFFYARRNYAELM